MIDCWLLNVMTRWSSTIFIKYAEIKEKWNKALWLPMAIAYDKLFFCCRYNVLVLFSWNLHNRLIISNERFHKRHTLWLPLRVSIVLPGIFHSEHFIFGHDMLGSCMCWALYNFPVFACVKCLLFYVRSHWQCSCLCKSPLLSMFILYILICVTMLTYKSHSWRYYIH